MTFHIVRMDEKIEKIALNYQLDIEEIKEYNKYIKDWNHLIPGTKLRLPEISNVLNEELDNYEPFIEEYYPKLSNNYSNYSSVDNDVEMVSTVAENNDTKQDKNVKQVEQTLNNSIGNDTFLYTGYMMHRGNLTTFFKIIHAHCPLI